MFNSSLLKCTFTSQQQKKKENQCKNIELSEKLGQTDHNISCHEICTGKDLKYFQGWSSDLRGAAKSDQHPAAQSILSLTHLPSLAPKGSFSNSRVAQQFSETPGGKLKKHSLKVHHHIRLTKRIGKSKWRLQLKRSYSWWLHWCPKED